MIEEKRCSKCDETKLVSEFHRNKTSKDGYKRWCKECRKDETKRYREKHREVINARKREAYYNSKKFVKEKSEEQLKQGSKTCTQCSMSKGILQFRERANGGFYSICRECENENNKEYRLTHPELIREIKVRTEQRRRARALEVESDFTKEQWKECLETFDNQCAYCGVETSDMCQDHFVPLSKGGGYTKSNIVPSCRSCNSKKHNILFEDWYPRHPDYLVERELAVLDYLKSL